MNRRERIIKIIEAEAPSQAEFARIVGLNTATLSHVITGRNNPSADVMDKILEAFPQYRREWLYEGTGEILQLGTIKKDTDTTNKSVSDRTDFSSSTQQRQLFSNSNQSKSTGILDNATLSTNIANLNSQTTSVIISEPTIKVVPAKVRKVIIYYEDNTFQTFVPELLDEDKKK